VADGRDAHAGDLDERFHQVLAAPAGADAGDVQRLIGAEGIGGGHAEGGNSAGGGDRGFQEGATRELVYGFHGINSPDRYRGRGVDRPGAWLPESPRRLSDSP